MDRFGKSDVVVGGTIPQKLSSCLLKLEKFMLSSAAVVSSYIPAISSMEQGGGDKGTTRKASLLSSLCSVIGESFNGILPQNTLRHDCNGK